jgi:DNA-binding NtrC family response regulator
VAPTDLTVFINGESGVGKESFSKIIHALSPRKHQTFIAINCGAIPEGTINSELFGHAKGGFTGAVADRKGYFETANGGTIFLDEIGEMPMQTQQFLLRVLEQGEFIKVGSSTVEKTNVRVIAATNVNLMEKVQQGKFREDLYYRLNTVPIRVPALRERTEDIYLLFRKFASDFAQKYNTPPIRLDEQAQLLLERYPFPGNIRELKNITEQVSVLAEDKVVDAQTLLRFLPQFNPNSSLPTLRHGLGQQAASGNGENMSFYEREILFKFLYDMKKDLNDLKALIAELARTNNLRMPASLPPIGASAPVVEPNPPLNFEETPHNNALTVVLPNMPNSQALVFQKNENRNQEEYNEIEEIEATLSIDDMEKDLILKALKKFKGRRKEAAKELGISERTLYRKIKQYDIEE